MDNNVTIEPESEIYKGSYSIRFAPKPESNYVPKNEREYRVCKGMKFLSEGESEKGLQMLLSAWDDGELWAGELLSYGYTVNWFGDNDYQMALRILYRLIRHNYPMSMNNLGFMYMTGQGVKKSDRWAKYWFEKAINHGCIYSFVNLANLLTLGPKKYRDYDQAVNLLKLAMKKGDPEAFNMMGICYHEGRGVEQNDKEAYRHYKLAYEKGAGPVSAYNLGRCYYFGSGIKKNMKKANSLFKEAEEGGFPVWDKLHKK